MALIPEPGPQGGLGGSSLTDLGMSTPSQSNSVGIDNPALVEFMKAAKQLGNPASEALLYKNKLDELNGTKDKSSSDFLSSLLLPLLAGGGLAMAGQGGLGAGLALGGLDSASLLADQFNTKKKEAIGEAYTRYEDATDKMDKIHTRMSTLFASNPDAFVDSETGEQMMSNAMLGWIATGAVGAGLDARSRRLMTARGSDPSFQKRYDLLYQRLEKAETADEGLRATEDLFAFLDWDAGPAAMADIRKAVMDGDMDQVLTATIGAARPESIVYATQQFIEKGLSSPGDDPGAFMRMLTFPPAVDSGSFKDGQLAKAGELIYGYMHDPANRERVKEVWDKHGAGSDEASRELAGLAMADNVPVLDMYVAALPQMLTEGTTENQLFSALDAATAAANDLRLATQDYIGDYMPGYEKGKAAAEAAARVRQNLIDSKNSRQRSSGDAFISAADEADAMFRLTLGRSPTTAELATAWDLAKNKVRQDRGLSDGAELPASEVKKRFDQIMAAMITTHLKNRNANDDK